MSNSFFWIWYFDCIVNCFVYRFICHIACRAAACRGLFYIRIDFNQKNMHRITNGSWNYMRWLIRRCTGCCDHWPKLGTCVRFFITNGSWNRHRIWLRRRRQTTRSLLIATQLNWFLAHITFLFAKKKPTSFWDPWNILVVRNSVKHPFAFVTY